MNNNIQSNQSPAGLGRLLTSAMIAMTSMFRGNPSAGNSDRRPNSSNDFPREFGPFHYTGHRGEVESKIS